MRVFLSYRREDGAAYAGRLRDTLAAQVGEQNTFLDVSTIKVGEDFEAATGRALDAADVELVVIGPRWLALREDGTTRLEEPGDYVRREILHALERDVPVVPVLVGGAELPPPSALTADLRPLVYRQAVRLHDESWHEDVSALVHDLSGDASEAAPRWRRWAVAAAVVLVAGVVLVVLSPRGGESPATSIGACEGLALAGQADSSWTPLVVPPAEETLIEAPDGALGYTATAAFYRRTAQPGRWQVGVTTLKHNVDRVIEGGESHGSWDYSRIFVDDIVAGQDPFCFEANPEGVLGPGESGRAVVGYDVTEDPTNGPIVLEVETQSEAGTSQFDKFPVTE